MSSIILPHSVSVRVNISGIGCSARYACRHLYALHQRWNAESMLKRSTRNKMSMHVFHISRNDPLWWVYQCVYANLSKWEEVPEQKRIGKQSMGSWWLRFHALCDMYQEIMYKNSWMLSWIVWIDLWKFVPWMKPFIYELLDHIQHDQSFVFWPESLNFDILVAILHKK